MTSPFDHAALTYDRDFTHSTTGHLQRMRVYHFLKPYLIKPLDILEINCGTGEDALWLGRLGHQVSATDGSEKMIEVAQEKLNRQTSLAKNISFRQVPFGAIDKHFETGKFDLVFSNFGGLNCLNHTDLSNLFSSVQRMLRPGGIFIAVVMGRKCIWEKVFYLSRLEFKNALRRSSLHSQDASIGDALQKTWYYNPAEIKKLCGNYFSVAGLKPVGLLLPPSYLEPFFIKHPIFLQWLNRLEEKLGYRYFSDYADHFFMALRKNQDS